MTIDTSGEFWKGSSADDIKEYLMELSENDVKMKDVHIASCDKCGCAEFLLEFDWDEGVARLICKDCMTVKYLADSEENWVKIRPRKFKCSLCKSKHANVGTGFVYRNNGDVKWVYIGVRCSGCGTLGSVADWKIDYSPTEDLKKNI